MSNQGWISIHRKLKDHQFWTEKRKFSKAEAWIDILLTVNHKQAKVIIKNTLITVERGQSILSLGSWSKRWNWNKSATRRFLSLLQQDEMIVIKNESITTRLTVCNYDSYQDSRNADETQMKRKRNANETQMTPNNNDNNINNENNENKLSFDDFWNLYDKKVGSKEKIFKKWCKLSDEEIRLIFEYVPKYKLSTPDKKYRKNPESFLNNSGWNDEIIFKRSQKTSQSDFMKNF